MYTLDDKYSLIKKELMKTTSINPLDIVEEIMKKDFINIHGPEHHFLDGGAFLCAIYNAQHDFDLDEKLDVFKERTLKMPGAMCGHWGVCGSVTSIGAALSVLHDVGPLSNDGYYSDDMEYTSSTLKKMSEIGGPRCCKRNAFIAISSGIQFVKEKYGIELEKNEIQCNFSSLNKQCIGKRCPFNKCGGENK